jgi:probable rRNA maturation factor
MKLQLHLSRSAGLSRKGIPLYSTFAAWVEAALRSARQRRDCELSIRIVDAGEGRQLNRSFRKRDYATNVLSFPAELPAGMKLPLIGDLVICAPVVAREAGEQGKRLRDHYAHMTIHGTLHLLGYDHENEADAERMEALERRILADLGIADPYLAT